MESSILSPKSIAIVGVSQDSEKIGSVILKNLINGGYNGKIYPINPKYEELQGRKVYPNILAIPEDIDMVCIAIPHQFVEDVVDQCVEKRVKSVLIISAGFREVGPEGAQLEERITTKLKRENIRLIGPNCLGFINNKAKINLTFARENPGDGKIAFISQSGAFCTAILDMACEKSLGFSHVVSIGNKADIHENELMELFVSDNDIKAIALYLEEFSDGKEFVTLSQKAKKPILLIAPGSSQKAQEAISSHTGSLASSFDTTIAAIKKGNMIYTENSDELFKLMRLIDLDIIPKGKGIGIVTNAGGPGVIAVDMIEKKDMEVAEIGEKTIQKLLKILPPEASIKNPVDILGDAKSDRYKNTINELLDEITVDSILVILTPQLITEIEATANVITELMKKTSKPIFSCFLGGKDIKAGIRILEEANAPWFTDIQEAIRLISKLAEFEENKELTKVVNSDDYFKKPKYKTEINEEIVPDRSNVIPDELGIKILEEFGIDTPKQKVVSSLEQGRDFASTIFPVAIKATSEDLAHKTDFKALHLDIRTISEFEEKYQELKETVTKTTGNVAPKILVQEMISGKLEFFIGANREGGIDIYEKDGQGFGHLLAIGQGGIYTEVYRDIRHILVPENREKIDAILSKTKVSEIIDGYRGKPPLPREKIIDLIMSIQKLLVSYPEIVSMDINPVIVTEDRAIVVDAKFYVAK
ncbi:MAG TPA: acetate--CoA ligase family protein [Candidatus Dojkabacteria bacterium]|nr:acetate--CoA ligase family protein [Candidatus Dojkabacteria bacterium]